MADISAELEILARDCEETADEAMKMAGAETTRQSAEARAWLSITYRIRLAAKRLKK